MAAVTHEIQRYLENALGIRASLAGWRSHNRLPLFLRDGYTFLQADLLGTSCLLMVDRGLEAPSPANIRKHMDQVRLKWNGEIIYVRGQLESYQRKRLVEQNVPFLVPGNQMYLPMLGVDLREHYRKSRQVRPALRPATQALVLHLLLQNQQEVYTPRELAERLGYSKMTMSRAFDDLEGEQLCNVSKHGRERWLRLKGTRQELWNTALPTMRSPVKQRKHFRSGDEQQIGVRAGLSALAKHSMLAPPKNVVVAVSASGWTDIKGDATRTNPAADDPGAVEIEIWSYDPKLFSKQNLVDRFSLFLSLKDSEDERIESALDEMMEAVEW